MWDGDRHENIDADEYVDQNVDNPHVELVFAIRFGLEDDLSTVLLIEVHIHMAFQAGTDHCQALDFCLDSLLLCSDERGLRLDAFELLLIDLTDRVDELGVHLEDGDSFIRVVFDWHFNVALLLAVEFGQGQHSSADRRVAHELLVEHRLIVLDVANQTTI